MLLRMQKRAFIETATAIAEPSGMVAKEVRESS